MYVTKKKLSSVSYKKLVDFIYEFSYWIKFKARWIDDGIGFFTGVGPDEISVTEDRLLKEMLEGEITSEMYKGALVGFRLLKEKLNERRDEIMQENMDTLKKLKLEHLLDKQYE